MPTMFSSIQSTPICLRRSNSFSRRIQHHRHRRNYFACSWPLTDQTFVSQIDINRKRAAIREIVVVVFALTKTNRCSNNVEKLSSYTNGLCCSKFCYFLLATSQTEQSRLKLSFFLKQNKRNFFLPLCSTQINQTCC